MLKRQYLKLLPLMFVIILAACGALDVLITACNTAPTVIVLLEIDDATKTKWNVGFTQQGGIFNTYKSSNRGTEAKKAAAFDSVENIRQNFIVSNNPKADAWITAIVNMIRSFFNIPASSNAVEGLPDRATVERAANRKVEITDEQAKEFERLVKGGPDGPEMQNRK